MGNHAAMTTTTPVHHDAEQQRYEYVVDGEALAIAEYRRDGDTVVMHHTYTDPRYRGRGYAARVVAAALDDVRARGLQVVPQCWFVAEFVASHPEYRDLVATA
jgi:predicted GNAT family acetyltransferase